MKIGLILTLFTSLNYFFCFSQEMCNEEYQKIIVMDGEQEGSLDIFVDPNNFGCECDLITANIIKSKNPNIYFSEDNVIKLEIKGNKYIISISKETDCCFVKAGVYKVLPSKWDDLSD